MNIALLEMVSNRGELGMERYGEEHRKKHKKMVLFIIQEVCQDGVLV